MINEFMAEREEYARQTYNSIQPLEFKINKPKIERMGLCP